MTPILRTQSKHGLIGLLRNFKQAWRTGVPLGFAFMGSCGLGCVVIGASPSGASLRLEVWVRFHVQQKKLTALHLKPKILRRDIRAVVDSGFTKKA